MPSETQQTQISRQREGSAQVEVLEVLDEGREFLPRGQVGMDHPERANRLPRPGHPQKRAERFLRQLGITRAELEKKREHGRQRGPASQRVRAARSTEDRYQRTHAVRAKAVRLERDLRADRMAEQHGLTEPRVLRDGPQIAGALHHRHALRVLGYRTAAVTAVIPGDDRVRGREVLRQAAPDQR